MRILVSFVPLIYATSIMIGKVEPRIEGLLRSLRSRSIIPHNLSIEHIPKDLSLEKTIKIHENTTAQIDEMMAYIFDPNSAKLLNETYNEMIKIYNFPKFHRNMDNLIECIINITSIFYEFKEVMFAKTSPNIFSLDKYFHKLIESDNIRYILKKMHRVINGHAHKTPNFFSLIGEYIREYKQGSCNFKKLTQAHVQNLYKFISSIEFCGSFMIISAHAHITRRHIDNHFYLIKKTMRNTEERLSSYSNAARKAMKQIPLEILVCDDENNVRNDNYIELSGMSKGFLLDSSLQPQIKDCHLEFPEKDLCASDPHNCFHKECWAYGGLLNQCRQLNETKLKVCISENDSKFYSWMKSEGKTYGSYIPEEKCDGIITEHSISRELAQQKKDESIPSFCFCNCEREKWVSGDVRAIALEWEIADHADNRVITNFKFGEKNGLIRLEIETGRILPGGIINQSSVSWRMNHPPFPEIDNESNSPVYVFNQTHTGLPMNLYKWIEDRDFVYVQKNLLMNINDLMALENHVIIGVGFTRADDGISETEIELIILTAEYNYTSGRLNPRHFEAISQSTLLKRKRYEFQRKKVDLGEPENPAKTKEEDTVNSEPFHFVEFEQSDFEEDLGQTIVPFIDTRPPKTALSSPLSGAGIYFRGWEKNYGVSIAPKLFIYDISNHFERDYGRDYLRGDHEM